MLTSLKRTPLALLRRRVTGGAVSVNVRRRLTAVVASRPQRVSALSSAARSFSSSASVTAAGAPASSASSYITKTADGLHVDRALPPTFTKVLIANRGEIACRVMRTCKQLGIRTVAVYSDADAHSQHVQMADEAYRIGEAPAVKSYLLGDKIIEIAKKSGAQAIHPGYGFLSENAEFAGLCAKSGVEFIGPPAKAIIAMGSKSASKALMISANVPVVPGYHGEDQSIETLTNAARKTGFPVMLKAVSGGGGKGMRIVFKEDEFADALEACKRESLSSFKDDRVLVEKYIIRPRHIEFQVFADKHGAAVHFHERDCSVQRRHQKVLEEAPAPGMTEELRQRMGKSAVDAALAVGYVGAGTVEFIFDAATNEYYFMEMNTRLQVEHPVTEMVMRRDLVQWQLHVAAGHKMPANQQQISASAFGASIEARIYAENPNNNFLPHTGKLVFMRTPAPGDDIRIESGVRQGDDVSIFYDPMIAKLVVWGVNRNAALARMSSALREYQIVGPPTNIEFVQRAVAHPVFVKGQVETSFIPNHAADLLPPAPPTCPHKLSLTVLALLLQERAAGGKVSGNSSGIGGSGCPSNSADATSPWGTTVATRLNSASERTVTLMTAPLAGTGDDTAKPLVVRVTTAEPATVAANGGRASYTLHIDGKAYAVCGTLSACGTRVTALVGERAYTATVARYKNEVHLFENGGHQHFNVPEVTFGAGAGSGGGGCIAPMAGKIVKVMAATGQTVKKGAQLAIMEAMKMEHVLRAPHDGVVEAVFFKVGDFVEGGKVVVSFVAEKKK